MERCSTIIQVSYQLFASNRNPAMDLALLSQEGMLYLIGNDLRNGESEIICYLAAKLAATNW
jgi:hypothetical protein